MELREATQVVAVLCAAYRVNDPATAAVYIEHLKDLDAGTTMDAINYLIDNEADWMPSVKMIRTQVEIIERDRSYGEPLPQLPPVEMTEEEEARVRELLGNFWGQPGRSKVKVQLAAAVRDGDKKAKIELGRVRAQEQIQQEMTRAQEIEREAMFGTSELIDVPVNTDRRRPQMCTGVGKKVVIRDDRYYCPDCADHEIEPGR